MPMNACNFKFQMWRTCFICYGCGRREGRGERGPLRSFLDEERPRKKGVLEKSGISCEAEVSRLGFELSSGRPYELWRGGFFCGGIWGGAQLCYSIGIPTQLCENICSLTCYTSHLETNPTQEKSMERVRAGSFRRRVSVNLASL